MRRTIYLYQVPPLLRYGLRVLLKDCEIQDIEDISSIADRDLTRSVIITTPERYLKELLLLSPQKRGDVVILSKDCDTISVSESGIHLLGEYSEAVDIQNLIFSLLNSEKDSGEDQKPELSARESEVLKEIASGKTFKEIAEALSISVNTVVTHRKNISVKLGIRSTSGLSVYALMNGLI